MYRKTHNSIKRECVMYVHIYERNATLGFAPIYFKVKILCPCFYFEIIIINNDDKDVRHNGVCPLTAHAIWVIF